jgi:hypothetical protein
MFAWMGNKEEPKPAPALGAVISTGSMQEEFNKMTNDVTKREKNLRRHLNINAKERVLADKLATAYVHNYSTMIDITGLLNQFAGFFKTMKDILKQSNIQLDQLNSDAFQNIERLTRQEMDRYSTRFYEQSQKVQKLFQDYQMFDKANKIASIPGMTQQLTDSVDALKVARTATGGKARKSRKKAT